MILGERLRLTLPHETGRPRGSRALSAAQLFVLSFLGLIAVGTLGLLVIPGLYRGEGLGFVDALFTATSAVCVTGLIVVDTATYFTPLGQAWILALIQAGGLGILTFSTLIIAIMGGRHLEMEEAAGGHAAYLRNVSFRSLLRTVLILTVTVEAIGAGALWLEWRTRFGPFTAAWHAIFHSISAFCNAGFSTFSDSLVSLNTSPLTVGTVSALIILGGLGFVVVEDLRACYVRKATRRLTVHSKLVLGTTAVLLLGGFLLYLLFEARNPRTLGPMSWPAKLLNAVFMSVTPRTAGFNTVNYDHLTNPAVVLTLILMTIGGSPGSTAGGIKTVPAALLTLLLWSRLRGRRHVAIFDRTVPWESVHRGVGLVVGGAAVLGIGFFILMATEALAHGPSNRDGLVRILFETHSAFGTVGLSMGATTVLSIPGRLVVTLLMFLGRVGPAAIVAAMVSARHGGAELRYAHEDVILG